MSSINVEYPSVVREILTGVRVAPHPSPQEALVQARALWDTGATFSVVSREMAMRIGGDSAFESISRESFSRMAGECRVSPQLCLSRLDTLAGKMPTVLQRLMEDFRESWPSDIYGAIEDVVLSHISRIKE